MFIATILNGREKYEMNSKSIITEKYSDAYRWLLKTLIDDCYMLYDVEYENCKTVEDFIKVNDITPDNYDDDQEFQDAVEFAKRSFKTLKFVSGAIEDLPDENIIKDTSDSYLGEGWKYLIEEVQVGKEFSI